MRGLFKRRSAALIGLDVGMSSVRMVQLSQVRNCYRLESYAVVPFSANELPNPSTVANAIALGRQWANIKTKSLALAVAGSKTITKTIQVATGLTQEEIASQISFEAAKYIPFPMEDVYFDFHVLGPSQNAETLDVLLVACRRETIESMVALFEEVSVQAKVVDVDSYALERAVALMDKSLSLAKGALLAVVDIEPTMMTLNILHDMQTVYRREEIFSDSLFTQEMQQRYRYRDPEKRHHALAGDSGDEAYESLREAIVLHLRHALQFFFSTKQYTAVDVIVMSGELSSIPGMTKSVEGNLAIKTILANPFADLAIAPSVNQNALMLDAPSLMISCGLALRCVNDTY